MTPDPLRGKVARTVRAWEYLFAGLVFAGAGLSMIFGSALAYATQASAPGLPLLLIDVAFGALVFGIGGYWLWKFDRTRRQEATRPGGRAGQPGATASSRENPGTSKTGGG